MKGYSFGIITNYAKPDKLISTVESIRKLNIPDYEIRIAVDGKNEGFLGKLRNQVASGARYDHLIITDDDVIFHDNFYNELLKYGEDYDILLPELLNPDGTRLWDWCEYGGPNGHQILECNVPDNGYVVTPGGCIIMKSKVFDRVKWNETIKYYSDPGEDYEYSMRLHGAGYILKHCSKAVVIHNDPRYHQQGKVVIRE
jgi:GT2 family glycosyltransferase